VHIETPCYINVFKGVGFMLAPFFYAQLYAFSIHQTMRNSKQKTPPIFGGVFYKYTLHFCVKRFTFDTQKVHFHTDFCRKITNLAFKSHKKVNLELILS